MNEASFRGGGELEAGGREGGRGGPAGFALRQKPVGDSLSARSFMRYTKRVKKALLLAFILFVVIVPVLSFAAVGLEGPLVQQDSDSDPGKYNLCKLLTVANNVITFAVAFSVIVATLMFAYGGILYVTAASGGPEQVKKAHKVLLNTFIGIVIVLIAWLIVNIILSVLTGQSIGNWTQVACQGGAPSTTQPTPQGQVKPVPKTPTQPSAGEEANRAALEAADVKINNPPCGGLTYQQYRATHNDQGCTDVGGLLPHTIDYLTTLPGYSDCTVTVTAGSEAGHLEHNGGEAVDIRSTSCISGFVSTFGSNKDPVTDYSWDYEGGGEPHYHVCTGSSCGL